MAEDIARNFLCLCLENKWDASAGESALQQAREAHLDWRSVRQLAYAEELAPLLYDLTRERGILPSDLERDLAAAYYATAAQNALRLRDLEQVLGLLSSAGVGVALLKGAALVETLYRNAAVRPMEDIDLLVRPDSISTAVQVLADYCGHPVSSAEPIRAFVDRERQMSFQKTGETETLFDLHWQVLDSPFHPHELFTHWVWDTSLPLQVGNASVMGLSREALLLHLCGHYLIDEGRKGLLWLYDIARLIGNDSTIDWDLLVDQARVYGLVLPVKDALSRIGRVWKNLIPASVAERVDALKVGRTEKAFYDWAASIDRAEVRLVRVNLSSLPRWPARLRYIGQNVFPSPAYMRHRYGIQNPITVWLTYPYRWLLSLYRAVLH